MFRKNDRIRVTITDMGTDGEGIGKVDGLPFFVKNALIGDEVLAVVTRMKKGYGYAKVLEILRPSEDRIEPACPLAGRCGGCQIMQLRYEAQLAFKERKVRNNLERIGGQKGMVRSGNRDGEASHGSDEVPAASDGVFTYPLYEPILGMEGSGAWMTSAGTDEALSAANEDPGETSFVPLHFRNKMQFPVGWDREGHVVTGFYAGRTHYLIAAQECPVAPEVNASVLACVRHFIEKHRLSTYQEETGEGLVRHVLIRNGFHTGQIMVCLVINGETLADPKDVNATGWELGRSLVHDLCALKLPEPWEIRSICLNSNTSRTNVILGDEVRCLYGEPYIEDCIVSALPDMRPLTFRINPRSFFQTNPQQTSVLYDLALSYAALSGRETVWDLYCGTGTISLFLAQRAGKVYGVEIIPEAIEDARANAKRNGITNAEFFCGKSEEVFPAMVQSPPDVVVLDPPRKGCDPVLLEAIRRVGPDRIVYVSCDSATLARDVRILCDSSAEYPHHYRLERVRPVDMFPHTVHVETVCLLSNRKPDTKVRIDVDLEDYYRIKDAKKNQN